jgi:hypothetical protein
LVVERLEVWAGPGFEFPWPCPCDVVVLEGGIGVPGPVLVDEVVVETGVRVKSCENV